MNKIKITKQGWEETEEYKIKTLLIHSLQELILLKCPC